MLIELKRYKYDGATTGILSIDGVFECYTLENPKQKEKIAGNTCIPTGTYDINLRTGSPMDTRYKDKFDFHKGMLWLRRVPDFTYIYIHIGNTIKDTNGCILVGQGGRGDAVMGSTNAYTTLYGKICDAAMLPGLKIKVTEV